jgi:AAA ATPase domain
MTATQPGLVGRDQPLAELQALVAAALASRGGLVTLTGEAGIGKTTLAAAAADHAEALGATVVWGACWEGAPPFWPWLEVLAALGAEVDLQADGQGGDRLRPPSAAAARFERFAAISGALLAATGALVVVLDDLHWADPASVELAAFHARRVRRSRQLLVATYRDVEVAPGDPLAGPLSRLAAEGATLPLGGLDAGQVAVVLAGITGGDPDPELAPGCAGGPAATRSSSTRSPGCWPPTRTRPRSRAGPAKPSGAGWPPSATRASGCWRRPRCSAPTCGPRSWPG